VHAAWQVQVARRRQRRWLAVAASVLVVLGGAWGALALRSPAAAPVVARVVDGAASLTIERGGRDAAADAGGALSAGDILHVGTARGVTLAVVRGNAEASLRLAAGSDLQWTAADQIQLLNGRVYLDIVPDRRGDHPPLEVVAGEVRIEHLGTRFMAGFEHGVVDVAVRDGSVRLLRGDAALVLGGGERAVLRAGTAVRSRLAPADPAWEWAETLAARVELEGRSLLAVLRDLSAEAGLELSFASPEIERQAAGTTLHGPPLGQPPRAALRTIVDTTLFTLEAEAGTGRVTLRQR
jgi:ferric-dicitrate binding protein FerR (iron transport regulator)